MTRWFRWYEGTTEDGKFRTVARNAKVTVATVMGVWAVLLEDASHHDHRGVATRGEDFWGAVLDLGNEELGLILSAMEGANLISVGIGDITITKWKERQFETDTTDGTNAERQRRWRNKHKPNDGQTQRNGDVTATKRPDTDTDTDKKEKETLSSFPKEKDGTEKIIRNVSRGTPFPENFQPLPNVVEDARNRGLSDAEISDELDAMEAWALNAGSKGMKKDWNRFARTWLRKRAADKKEKLHGYDGKTTRADAFAILDAVTDEAIRREGRGQDGNQADIVELPRLRQSAA